MKDTDFTGKFRITTQMKKIIVTLCSDSQKLLKSMSPDFQSKLLKGLSLVQGSVIYI